VAAKAASLDSSCARLLGTPRVGAEKRASGRTEKLGQVKGDEASTRLLSSIARFVLFVSPAPPLRIVAAW
jgi:hypothetical protein